MGEEEGGDVGVGVGEMVVFHHGDMLSPHCQQDTLVPGVGGAKYHLEGRKISVLTVTAIDQSTVFTKVILVLPQASRSTCTSIILVQYRFKDSAKYMMELRTQKPS